IRVSLRVAGLAVVASVAAVVGQVVAMAPGALAFGSPSVATLTAGTGVSFSAGGSGEPAGDVTLGFTDNSGTSVWSAGDHVTFQLWDNTSNGPLSNTSSNTLDSAAFAATPLITATNSIATSAYSVALAQSGTSSVNDEFTLNFAQDAPKDSNLTSFVASGISITPVSYTHLR